MRERGGGGVGGWGEEKGVAIAYRAVYSEFLVSLMHNLLG